MDFGRNIQEKDLETNPETIRNSPIIKKMFTQGILGERNMGVEMIKAWDW